MSNIILRFKTTSYTFFNFSQTGNFSEPAVGFSYFPYVENPKTEVYESSNNRFTITQMSSTDMAYFGNTNVLVFYPKFGNVNGTSVVELASYMKSIQIGNTVYDLKDGYNASTHRFDFAQVSGDGTAYNDHHFPTTFRVGDINYSHGGKTYICDSIGDYNLSSFNYDIIKAFKLTGLSRRLIRGPNRFSAF